MLLKVRIKVYFNNWRDKISTFAIGIKICKRKSSLAIPQIELIKEKLYI